MAARIAPVLAVALLAFVPLCILAQQTSPQVVPIPTAGRR